MEETKQKKIIRVAIVDDDELQRNSLRWLIDDTEGYICTGSYKNCAEAKKGITETMPMSC